MICRIKWSVKLSGRQWSRSPQTNTIFSPHLLDTNFGITLLCNFGRQIFLYFFWRKYGDNVIIAIQFATDNQNWKALGNGQWKPMLTRKKEGKVENVLTQLLLPVEKSIENGLYNDYFDSQIFFLFCFKKRWWQHEYCQATHF